MHDSCTSIISECLNRTTYGSNPGTQKATWLALGLEWEKMLRPLYAQGTSRIAMNSDAQVIAYGLKPSEWSSAGFEAKSYDQIRQSGVTSFAYRGEKFVPHPLFLALMFSKIIGDQDEAAHFFAKYEALPVEMNNGRLHDFWNPTWIPPYKPADFGRSPYKLPRAADSVSMLAWFDPKFIESMFTQTQSVFSFDNITNTVLRSGATMSLAERADRAMHQGWNSNGRLNYAILTTVVRLTTQLRAETLLSSTTGVKQALGIVRRDTPSPLMVKGLRAVTGMTEEGVRTFSALYGRAPTISEIREVRGSGLINVLYYMPWDILEVLLEEDSSTLRAMTLPHMSALDGDKRHCLQRHDRRVVLLPYAGVEKGPPPRVSDKTNVDDWEKVFRGLATQYQRSKKARDELTEIAGDPAVAVTALLPRFGAIGKVEVDRILKHHPRFEQLEAVAARVTEPTDNPDHLANI